MKVNKISIILGLTLWMNASHGMFGHSSWAQFALSIGQTLVQKAQENMGTSIALIAGAYIGLRAVRAVDALDEYKDNEETCDENVSTQQARESMNRIDNRRIRTIRKQIKKEHLKAIRRVPKGYIRTELDTIEEEKEN